MNHISPEIQPALFTIIKVLFILLPGAGLITACSDNNNNASVAEIYQEDETEQAELAAANIRKLQEDFKTTHVARGSHAKSHGCVQAWFDTNHYIDFHLRYGIFTKPGQRYKAWIRFSNGHFNIAASHDQERDVRGMAIKILAPPGEPLQLAANGIPAQDFLMTDSPIFFIKNISDYNDLIANPESFLRFVFNGWYPFNWRIAELFLARKVLRPPPTSLLTPQYYSVTAYKLGPHNIKFSARPCAGQEISTGSNKTDPDFLRHNLQQALEAGEACFDFMVQLQNPEKNMPVENPAIEWKETESPFIPMAKVTLLSQIFDAAEQMEFCENLSFNPWHTHPDLKPTGQFNRIRQNVYQASSKFRHEQNTAEVSSDIAH